MRATKTSLLALGMALALLAGCGTSALRGQATAATVASVALDTGGQTVDAARSAALDAVEARETDREARDAALRAEAARWAPVGAALDACRDALLTWIETLELARRGDEGALGWETFVPLVARVVLLYDSAARLASGLGVELPLLPDTVRALATYPEGR